MLSEKCGGLPVVGHDGCWSDMSGNVLREGWRSDDAPVECVVLESPECVCGNGDVESVIGDWDGCSVGSVMPQVIGVDVGESGRSGSWDGNVVDQNVLCGLSEKCDGHGRKVVVWVVNVVHIWIAWWWACGTRVREWRSGTRCLNPWWWKEWSSEMRGWRGWKGGSGEWKLVRTWC